MKTFVSLLLLISFSAFALEVDEKLTVRIIKTSESKKTIMINRGTEDGIVENDHAKFIVTAGIVARAVCVRVSPTRSVWSVYRLVNADFILNDSVMTLKITPPVKVTKDETQTLVQDDTPTKVSGDPTALGIPLADGAQDLGSATDDAVSKADLKALEEGGESQPTSIAHKNMEVFGMMAISGLSAQSKTDSSTFNNSQSFMHIGLGAELYAKREREWYSTFSLVGNVDLMNESSQAYNGAGVTNRITELSLGTNWHPFKLPGAVNEFIPFIHLSGHFGTVNSSYKSGSEASNGDFTQNGTTNGFAIGLGMKFYTYKGFGVRALLDYYMRNEAYKEDELTGIKFTKVVGGPRLLLGLSYRF